MQITLDINERQKKLLIESLMMMDESTDNCLEDLANNSEYNQEQMDELLEDSKLLTNITNQINK